MKKIILFFLICNSVAFAYSYNELLLKAQATIFPKLLLLDEKLDEKLVNGKIVYTIVYKERDYFTALEVRDLLETNHNHGLNGYKFVISMIKYSDISPDIEATALYALNAEKDIAKVARIALSKNIITFAYNVEDTKKGLLFSLAMERSTVIYLNREVLQNCKVDFVDSLYQIVRLIDAKQKI